MDNKLLLTGFSYSMIHAKSPLDAKTRLKWLEIHDTITPAEVPDPQPYRELAEVMKKQGHDDEARTILRICAERRIDGLAIRARREAESDPQSYCKLFTLVWLACGLSAYLSGFVGTLATWAFAMALALPVLASIFVLPNYARLVGKLEWFRVFVTQHAYRVFLGHGYARWRALGWMAAFVLFGFVMFSESSSPPVGGKMQPVQTLALKEWSTGQSSSFVNSLPKYNALIYSADTLVPLVSFHQEDHWMPSGNGRWGWFIKNIYLPLHISAGWVIATLFVASFTRLMRQEG